MITINLLPWRQKQLKIANIKFGITAGFFVIILLFMFGLCYLYFNNIYKKINIDNKFIKKEIRKFDSKIREINEIQERRELLLKRGYIIQNLQYIRPFVVQLFDELVPLVPDGVIFNQIQKNNLMLKIEGTSISNSNISLLMKGLENISWVDSAKLTEIVSNKNIGSMNYDGNEVIKFTVEIDIIKRIDDSNES